MFAKIKRFIQLDPDFRPQARNIPVPPRDYAPSVSDLLHSFAHDAIEAGDFDESAKAYLRYRTYGSTIPVAIEYARDDRDL
jgi:hypothetical protein